MTSDEARAEGLVKDWAEECIGHDVHGARVLSHAALRALVTRVAAALPAPPRPGPLVTCPWCGADQRDRIAEAQIGHLIECGDHVRARLQGILDNDDE